MAHGVGDRVAAVLRGADHDNAGANARKELLRGRGDGHLRLAETLEGAFLGVDDDDAIAQLGTV